MTVTTPARGLAPTWLARAQTNQWSALPVLLTGTFMIVLDFFIVNVALPSMQTKLHAGPASIQWVVAGYGLTFSALLITAGRVGDRIGRRRLFSAGLFLFAAASAGCGLAPTAAALVGFRLVQGAAAALISPTVLAILGVTYTGENRVRAITIYGTVMGVAAASGQLIGGLVIQANPAGLGWRSVFLINLPVAAIALVLAPRLIPESRADSSGGLDLVGTALATAGITAIVLALVEGRQDGWPAWTILSLAAAPVVLAVFVAHQRRLKRIGGSPLLDMDLFKERAFAAGLLTHVGLWLGQASFFLVLALYLQQGRGLDALHAGLVFTIVAASYMVASMRSGRLAQRFGRSVIGGGALILGVGHLALLAGSQAGGSIVWLAPGLLLVGTGMGLCIAPLTTVILASSNAQQAGAVSGVLSTVQQVGNSIGVAITGVIFFGAVHAGFGHAFGLSVLELAGLLFGVACVSRLLPARAGAWDTH